MPNIFGGCCRVSTCFEHCKDIVATKSFVHVKVGHQINLTRTGYFCFKFLIGNLLGVATDFEKVQKMEGDNGLIKAKEGKEWYSKERKGDTQLEFLCLVVE
jgi:hypothetical protein